MYMATFTLRIDQPAREIALGLPPAPRAIAPKEVSISPTCTTMAITTAAMIGKGM